MPRKGENIYKRKDGRWEGRFLESYNPDGKGKYHSVYASSYTEAKEKLNCFKNQTFKSPSRSSKLAKYCADWLGVVRLNHKESTYCKYRNVCEH
ncbi:MAG: site-specific integrase, partial [Porcipelethomonas sp.]